MAKYIRKYENGDFRILSKEEKNEEDAGELTGIVALIIAVISVFIYSAVIGTNTPVEKIGAVAVFIISMALAMYFSKLSMVLAGLGVLLIVLNAVYSGKSIAQKSREENAAAMPQLPIEKPRSDTPAIEPDAERAEIATDTPPKNESSAFANHSDGSEPTSVQLSVSAEKPVSPALNTYYFLVSKNGVSQTLSLTASDPEHAKEILRKFRGNPNVIQGPSNSIEW
jgi:hypothetical protein